MVSTRTTRFARSPAQPASKRAKPVEPARERQRTAESNHPTPGTQNPTTRSRTKSPWFRHGPLASLAARLNQLRKEQSRLNQHVSASERLSRNHPQPKNKPNPGPRTRSPWFRHGPLASLAARLNQLRKEQSRLSQHVRVGRLPSPQLVYRDHKFQP